ncbi:hypothetical protein OQA88_3558 [Cercophora sp. LCS_1]
MDILKVLSRGIKNKKSAQPTAPTTLPSAGARPNPQFFHDDIPNPPRGKKRKRKKTSTAAVDDNTVPEDAASDTELSDIDFFAPPKTTTSPKQAAKTTAPEPVKPKPKPLDDDECRAILKSHRLKFTILGASPSKPPKKKKKKSSTDESKKKPDQIYPQPLRAFGELRHVYDVHETVAQNVYKQGFRQPTEVQMGSLPLLLRPGTVVKGLEGSVDFLGVAPTGSGKTISFLIPAIDGVIRRREGEEHVLGSVVVAPTRELAQQIVNEGRKLAIGTGVRVVLMKGGMKLPAEEIEGEEKEETESEVEESENEDEAPEKEDSEEGSDAEEEKGEKKSSKEKPLTRVDILVTTPKTLLNFLAGEKVKGQKTTLKRTLPPVRSLILDEADVLLDPIFRKQTLAIWRACTNPELSLTCWSATMASNVETLIAKQLDKRARLHNSRNPLIRLVVGLKDTAVPNITHKLIYTATEQGKLLGLRQLLHPVSSTDSGPPLRPPFLVFTQTIERAQSLYDELQYDIPIEAGGSTRIAVLHSSLGDSARSKIMARFRAGEVWVLITTDVLARGVDFAGVNGVVNYDVPGSAAAYVHRAGRTGRAGREGGVAVTFYTKDDIPFVKSVANVIAASEKQAAKEDGTVQKWLLDALPKVAKEDKRKLKVRGVEARRTGGKASISTKSAWERRKEHNRAQAIEASKRRKREGKQGKQEEGDDGEWGGLDD